MTETLATKADLELLRGDLEKTEATLRGGMQEFEQRRPFAWAR